jgi:predicted anti-sigma-YlaC factor YlaD
MRCRKTRRLLPLLAGSELDKTKKDAVQSHLSKCSRCQAEYEKYVYLVQETRKWLLEDSATWEEDEWQQVLQNATRPGPARRSSFIPWPFENVWAFVLMVCVALILVILVARPPIVERIGMKSARISSIDQKEWDRQKQQGQQDVVSLTMVSRETGLKIVWFFNKNFDLEEKK